MARPIAVDLIGQTFGRWTVLSRAPKTKSPGGQHTTIWNAICACGRESTVRAAHLTSGRSKGCRVCFEDGSR